MTADADIQEAKKTEENWLDTIKSDISDDEETLWASLSNYLPKADTFFDSSAELAKSFVRELFLMQSKTMDGACAAILHLTQSRKLRDYYTNR